jgi:RNA polymerase sigma-70 factor (ECF subfamily)
MTSGAAAAQSRQIGVEDLLAYRETVFLICLGFTHHYWDAQELAHETYVQAQERLHQLREPCAAKAWLCRLARNLCLDHLRKYKRWSFLGLENAQERSENDTPENLLVTQEQAQLVRAAIQRLPAKLREVLVLNAYGELTYAEIAGVLEVPVGTVMSRLFRARSAVKEELEKGKGHV